MNFFRSPAGIVLFFVFLAGLYVLGLIFLRDRKEYLIGFLTGLVLGLIYFWGSILMDVSLISYLPLVELLDLNSAVGLYLLGLFYVVLGTPIFLVYLLLDRKRFKGVKAITLSFIWFSMGIYVAFFSLVSLGLIGISRGFS